MYKEGNIQIDDAWLTQLLGKSPENALYINEEICKSHNINTSPVDLNIQNINDIDSDEEYNEIDVVETCTGNTDTILQTSEIDVSSITHITAPGEGNIPVFNEPLAEYLSFPTIYFVVKPDLQIKKDLLNSIQVKFLNRNYIQLTLELLFISQLYFGNQTLTDETYDGEGVLGHVKKQNSRKNITAALVLNAEE